jgi:hypothetical protein
MVRDTTGFCLHAVHNGTTGKLRMTRMRDLPRSGKSAAGVKQRPSGGVIRPRSGDACRAPIGRQLIGYKVGAAAETTRVAGRADRDA